jgi:putative transposase
MLIQQAFKYQLKENRPTHLKVRQFAGCRRFVFNKALGFQIQNHAVGGKYLSYETMAGYLTAWRNDPETAWLKDAPYHCLQQALKDLHKAYVNFFEKRAAFPQFKKKGKSGDSFRFPDPKQIKLDASNNRLFLPKLGWINYHNSRKIKGDLRNVTVSVKAGKVFASIQTQREVLDRPPLSTKSIGADVGITNLVTTSDGARFAPLNPFKIMACKLIKLQRQMSHKVKFSKNWKKIKAKITKLHAHIANMRKDYLHEITATLSKNHALVAVEDLQVGNMSASAKGTVDNPGKNVNAKAGLNRSILDQGWGEFFRQLEYKMEWNHGWMVKVPAHYTSQTCPCCGHVSRDNRKTQEKFLCVECYYENHADVVGAINVLDRALASLA